MNISTSQSSPRRASDALAQTPGMTGSCGMAPSSASDSESAIDRTMQGVKQSSRQLARDIQNKAVSAVDAQRERTTQRLDRVARAIRTTALELDAEDEAVVAGLAHRAAGGVDRASDYLRGRDISAMLHDAERIARSHPAICLGTAFLVGAIAGRVLRASRRHDEATALQASAPQPLGAFSAESEYAPFTESRQDPTVRSESSMVTQGGPLRGGLEGAQG